MSGAALVVVAGLGGFAAGALTTTAGLGGGIALTALLGLWLRPDVAVAVTAPALLVGNYGRVLALRAAVDRPAAAWYLLGALPGAVAAGLLLPSVPLRALRVTMAVALLAYVATALYAPHRRTRPRSLARPWLAVGGALSGAASATVGGGTPVVAPFYDRYGLDRAGFVATDAVGQGTVHGLKLALFSATGLLTAGRLPLVAAASAGMLAGNAVGARLLGRLSAAAFRRLLLGAMVAVALAYLR